MKSLIFITILVVLSFSLFAQEDETVWDDFKTSASYMGNGAISQFKGTQNLILWGASGLTVGYYLKNDKKIYGHMQTEKKDYTFLKNISDSAIFFNTPILPIASYFVARNIGDHKFKKFAMEYFATLSLTLMEANLISMIPMHERPNPDGVNFWEKNFRHSSSFPSGHVVGFSVLGLKLFQYYGFLSAAPVLALAAATAYERIYSEKHYASDVIASGFLSLLASEGVRMAAGCTRNAPFYKWIFEKNLSINYIRKNGIPGLLVGFSI